jgi:hypothetical protein
LIEYQQSRRQLIQFEDGVYRNLRQILRDLEQLEVNLQIQRRAVAIAIRRVDQTRETLSKPVPPALPGQGPAQFGPTAALNLLTALSDLRNSQNNLMSVRLNYHAARLRLMRELGVMRIDENGLWIEESLESALRATEAECPLPPELLGDFSTPPAGAEAGTPPTSAPPQTPNNPPAAVPAVPPGSGPLPAPSAVPMVAPPVLHVPQEARPLPLDENAADAPLGAQSWRRVGSIAPASAESPSANGAEVRVPAWRPAGSPSGDGDAIHPHPPRSSSTPAAGASPKPPKEGWRSASTSASPSAANSESVESPNLPAAKAAPGWRPAM